MVETSDIGQIAAANQKVTSAVRQATDDARLAEIRSLQTEMRAAISEKDTKKLNLVTIRLQEIIKSEGQEKKHIVDSLKDLRDTGKALGLEISIAEEETPAEKAALAAATQVLKSAETAHKKMVDDPPWFMPESRTESALEAVNKAKEALEQVRMANARAATARLDNIDVEQASEKLIEVSENSQKAIEDRRTVITAEVESAKKEITRLEASDQKLATELDKLKTEVVQVEQRLADAKVDLDREKPGTEKYAIEQQNVQKVEDALKTAINARDTAMEVRNQVQLNLSNTKIHLAGQRDIMTALQVFQKTMEEQKNGLVVQYKSRVEAARALADLKFGSDVHKTGNTVMEGFADYMAKAGSAANKEVVEMAEGQPESIRRARATRQEQDDAAAATQARIDAVFADMERDYKPKQEAA